MRITDTKPTDVKIVGMDVFGNHRGFFTESHLKAESVERGLDCGFAQDNHSLSVEAGVFQGLHFQKRKAAQTELICMVIGAVLDVIVDIRRGSSTHDQWDEFVLSEYNHHRLLIPKGYAHGFVALTPNADFLYKCDNYYNAGVGGGITFDDPDLTISWPIDPSRAIMPEKDHRHSTLKEFEVESPSAYGEI